MSDMTWYTKVVRKIQQINPILTFILSLAAIVTLVSRFINWGISGSLQTIYLFINTNAIYIWLGIMTLFLVLNRVNLAQLNRRFLYYEFKDNFVNLGNWDYVGPWRIPEPGTLLVTGSDEGGITKVGSNWENYTIEFRARIMESCLGVIVRAKDLYNYHMFQIWTDKIRPHYKYTSTLTRERKVKNGESIIEIFSVYTWEHDGTSNNPVYNAVPLTPKPDNWFDVKLIVLGASIKIFINSELILDQPSSLNIFSGKVGFRNSTNESAQVKDLSVKLI